ncbi:hypothetical protein KDL01_14070 [Actinospica durhamensis]|uniref:Uncharacterized protein n=1 Tax=Actinospica durhamensis TaxID=1508375 RepID=A0A941EPX9_9ACTN|nr:hypothetical protein [Actinospica durhamensis]MBR7834397.1 hypothetical protein [Actinospica durhamensis]
MTVPEVPLGPAEFQLIVLRRMADYQPELVEDARRRLGFSATDMRAANAQWQRMLHSKYSRGPVGSLRSVLGEPAESAERKIGDLTCYALQWSLPLWPELRFEAMTGPGGMLLTEHFVRAPGARRPVLRRFGDARPWSCVLGDVATAFGPLRHLEGSAPTRDLALAQVPDDPDAPDAGSTTIAFEFVYGLLQTARVYVRP